MSWMEATIPALAPTFQSALWVARMLRLRLLLFLLLLSLPRTSWAEPFRHRVEINGTFGYRFGGAKRVELERVVEDARVATAEGRLTVAGAPAYGALLSFRPQPNGTIFVSYSRQQAEFVSRLRWLHSETGQEQNEVLSGRGSIEYFQFGGNVEKDFGVVLPYLGASIGVTRFAGMEQGQDSTARFNITLDGGLRFELMPLLDLRVFGRVPFTFTKKAVYCYEDWGCADATNGAPFAQGELQLGLGVRF